MPEYIEQLPVKVAPGMALKRIFDILGATVLIVLFSPLLLLGALAVRLTSPGPVLFKQKRLGMGGRLFEIFKFRSMVVNAGEIQKPPGAKKDPRFTSVGPLLRKTKIDELPQLFNVLAGDMSLVGPRPLFPNYYAWYSDRDKRRLEMRPGVTGLQQVEGVNNIDWAQRIDLDLDYIDHWSLGRDLLILLKTPFVVLFQTSDNDKTGLELSALPTRYVQEHLSNE
jgi:lipopolysaccharide/colanic/teichoic acid biosynthesis glycosyltransferase